MDAPVDCAQLALLLEVTGTPKPGNVDRQRDLSGLRFEHFLAGAIGARPGLEMAATGEPVGESFERAVAGMAAQEGGNTQFGSLLLLVPLVRAASDALTPARCETIATSTTTADAAAFYRAFDHVDVFVDDPPTQAPDVRRGSEAIPAVRDRELDLQSVLALGVPGDDVAREWVTGFERSFDAAARLEARTGPAPDRAAAVFLELLAERPDTFVTKRHGAAVAESVQDRARTLLELDAFESDRGAVSAFADDLVAAGINPGTTADITAAGLFIALADGTITV